MKLNWVLCFLLLNCSIHAEGILAQRAKVIEKNLRQYNLYHGLVCFYKSNNEQLITYGQESDAALRTGLYLSAQSFQWREEPSPKLLNDIKITLRAIKGLTTISGIDGLLVRHYYPGKPRHKRHRTSPIQKGWSFRAEASRDQITGVLWGLATCAHYVKEETVQKDIKDIILSMAYYIREPKPGMNWVIVRPFQQKNKRCTESLKMMISGLAWRIGQDQSFKEDYRKSLNSLAKANIAVRFLQRQNRYAEYYSNNLQLMRYVSVLFFEENDQRRQKITREIHTVFNRIKDHRNAWFNYLTFQSLAVEERQKIIAENLHISPLRDAEKSLLQLTEAKLRGEIRANNFPYQEQIHPSYYITKKLKHWIKASSPPKKTSAQPIPLSQQQSSGFIWQKSPYIIPESFPQKKRQHYRASGVDFLCAYWLGRVAGFLNKED